MKKDFSSEKETAVQKAFLNAISIILLSCRRFLKQALSAVTVLLFFAAVPDSVAQTTYYSQGDLDAVSVTSWNTDPAGAGTSPADFTGNNTWIIQTGDQMTLSGNWTVGGPAFVTIEGGLIVSSDYQVTVTGTLTVNGTLTNSGTYNGAASPVSATGGISVNGTWDHARDGGYLPTASWNAGSTCLISGWEATMTLGNSSFDQAFHHFTWNCPGQSADVGFAGYVSTVNGTFTLANTGSANIYPGGDPVYGSYVQTGGLYNVTHGESFERAITVTNDFSMSDGTFYQSIDAVVTLEVGNDFTMSGGVNYICRTSGSSVIVGGDMSLTGGQLTLATADATGYIDIEGSLSVTGSEANLCLNDGSGTGTLYVGGNFTHTAGTISETSSGSGSVIFDGTGVQTYTSGGTLTGTINFTAGNGGNLPVLTMGTGAAPSFISSGSDGSFSILQGATLVVTSPEGISSSGATGNIQVTGTRTFSQGADYIYRGSSAQTTGTGLSQNEPGDITIDNAAGVTLTDDVTVSGTVTFTNGLLNTDSNTLIISNNTPDAVSGASGSSYLTGTLRRNIASGANTYIYPLGTVAAYTPVSLSFDAATEAGYLEGSTTDGDNPQIATSIFDADLTVNRTWTFSVTSGLAVMLFDATYNWISADEDPGFDYSTAGFGEYNGSSWSYPAVTTRNPQSIVIEDLTGAGQYQVGYLIQIVEPDVQASNVLFSDVTASGMTVSWTNGNGASRIVLVKAGSIVDDAPADGNTYSADATFGNGDELGTGNFVVYSGSGSSVAISGLASETTYHVAVFEYNGSFGFEDYLTTSPATGSQATAALGQYRSFTDGDWNDPSSWEFFDGSIWIPAVSTPTAPDEQISILTGHEITVTADLTVDEVIVSSGGQLSVSSGVTMTVADDAATVYDLAVSGILDNGGTVVAGGTVSVENGAQYIHSSSGTSIPSITWQPGSTCRVTGWTDGTALNSSFDQTFYNFIWDCASQAANVSFDGFVSNVTNTFTVTSTGAFYISPAGAPVYGSYVQTGGEYRVTNSVTARTVTITGDFSISGGAMHAGGAGSGTVNIGGDYSCTGGTLDLINGAAASGTVNVTGDFSHTGGTITNSSGTGTGTVVFNGTYNGVTGMQIFSSGGIISGSVNFTVSSGACLQMNEEGTLVGGAGTFTLTNGAYLGIRSANGIALTEDYGHIRTPGTRSFGQGAVYIYNGTSNQSTGTGLPSTLTGKLVINNQGAGGLDNVTLGNATTVSTGGSVDINDGVFTAGTNLAMEGTSVINRSGGSMTGTLQGTGIYNVNYSGNSMTTTTELSGEGLNDITVGLTAGQTLTLDQDRAPDGDLTINSGILDLGTFTCNRSSAGGILTLPAGTSLRIGGTSTLPEGYDAVMDLTGTVEYYGGLQTIAAEDYGNLVISGTRAKTIAAGSAVTVTGDLTTADSLIIESSGLLSSGSLIVDGTVTGVVTYNRQLRTQADAGDYHYLSSPVSGLAIADLVAQNTFGEPEQQKITGVWEWDEATALWPDLTLSAGSFTAGRGYNLSQNPDAANDGKISFTGTPVSSAGPLAATSPYSDCDFDGVDYGTRTILPGRTGAGYGGGGWNLLGNPFTSALDADEFLTVNAGNFDPNYEALYVYDGSIGTYGEFYYVGTQVPGWDGDGPAGISNIQAGQGFFVLAMCNSSQFAFTPAMRTHSATTPVMKSGGSREAWPGVKLTVSDGSAVSNTTVVYDEEMTPGPDPGYDVGMFDAGADLRVYTALVEDNGINYTRQALPLSGCDSLVIPVGVDSEEGGSLTFSAFTRPVRNFRYYLEDRQTGIFTDMGQKSYTVTLPEKTFGTGRFFIHVSFMPRKLSDKGYSDLRDLRIWSSKSKVSIQGEVADNALCEIFDLRGNRVLMIYLDEGSFNTFEIPSDLKGTYVIRLTDNTRRISQILFFL